MNEKVKLSAIQRLPIQLPVGGSGGNPWFSLALTLTSSHISEC